ncbi:tRNA dihydrouridine(20/20a) synthase DusA [Rivibacter subsaxonicus]|uniref:tRNA-dihydrouridine(20/20a) synthase n=1 Tax=Rivibacter subsaxonicus TaxID=457575 RepID=A0A4Q7VD86_9BURK|nr:tRNA dihydrouridine(20/20a) synthase DusA [Rivibacter subsaxonicus]RZT93834.1 tRNA-U16,U17-dihydrouridine synthase [Rivibacter subsaxonicus]
MTDTTQKKFPGWRLSVAPMMEWTDRNCRVFHRLLTQRTLLYTEMVTTGALIHGDVARHLDFHDVEHPVALQLGGSEPADLAHAARLGAQWGYDEINLNCGCPSERVQRGAFGACLMAEPALVRDCVKAMVDAVALPVTVKHRIGIDQGESYEFVRDFVGTVAEGGCRVFIVHARNAWLKGLSPKENREIPPLRYEMVYRLKRDFPDFAIVLNGGVTTDVQIAEHLQHVDGVMLGRHAYHEPWALAVWDAGFLGAGHAPATAASRSAVEEAWVAHLDSLHRAGQPWMSAMRHAMGLWNGVPGARRWRQVWSDHRLRGESPRAVQQRAAEAMRQALAETSTG